MINYNGASYLRASLPAALGQAERFEEILLVDHASTDGSLELVAREFPSVRVVRLEENRGACGARNAGIRAARTDLLLFLDNDVILLEGCVERLLEALVAHPDAVLAAPSVMYASAPEIVQYCGADNHYELSHLQQCSRVSPGHHEAAENRRENDECSNEDDHGPKRN